MDGSGAALPFVSAGAAQALVRAVAADGGIAVDGSFGAVGAMLERFRAGDACDVVILTHAQIVELTASAQAIPGTAADLGSVPTSIAVRDAAPVPDVASGPGLRAAVLAADAIYFPDPSRATAGIHFAKVLDGLGIRGEVESRLRTFPNGATAMAAMAKAQGSPIGCTQSTEIIATPGVKLVAPLPKGFDLETVYTAAVSGRAAAREAAAAFVARLTGPGVRPMRAGAGFGGEAIRPAIAADAEAIRAIVRGVLDEYRLAPDPAGIDRDLDDPLAAYAGRGGMLDAVVDARGCVIGCCGIYPLDEGACELRKMYLVRQARGKGLGKRLLDRALAFARGRGFERVELETASVLDRAMTLYAAAGFRPLARKTAACRCDRAFALALR
jgi:molybdate transport system substrate-binding protein